jgi:pseudomonalisin
MRRRTGVSAGVSALACLGLASLSGPAHAATTWAPTATKAVTSLPSSAGAGDLGALSGSTPMTVQVVLGLRHQSQLRTLIGSGAILSHAAVQSRFSPTAAQVSRVEQYLSGAGLTPTAATANNTIVTATGSAAAVDSAFHTTVDRMSLGSVTGYGNVTPASVPTSLGSTVVSVLGLNDLFEMSIPLHAPNPPTTGCTDTAGLQYPCEYNPNGIRQAYDAVNVPKSTGGVKTKEAIFADGDLTQVISDLRTEEAANKQPQVPYQIVATGPASTDVSGVDEWDLDTQYSTGMAHKVKRLDIYDASSLSDSDLAVSFADFASRDAEQAGSASFGECEVLAYADGSMLADDEQFEEAAAQGQTVFVSAGDTGGQCTIAPTNGIPAGVPDVEYPASSPYVVGVGGTTLITNAVDAHTVSYNSETAWTAGGGGVSYFEPAPSWQAGDGVVGTLAGMTDLRTLPDVSMDADPESGANVYVDGQPEGVGGTSLASPLALGVWDRIETAHDNGVPFASPLLYAAGSSSPAFHDVTAGDTGPYPATPGYDLATGLGTFQVANAADTFK